MNNNFNKDQSFENDKREVICSTFDNLLLHKAIEKATNELIGANQIIREKDIDNIQKYINELYKTKKFDKEDFNDANDMIDSLILAYQTEKSLPIRYYWCDNIIDNDPFHNFDID